MRATAYYAVTTSLDERGEAKAEMKQLVTFRLDAELLERVRRMAQAENRTLTNFVETVLKRSFEHGDLAPPLTTRGDSEARQV
jgi:predicted HicB family RNase H-like nuclease